MNPNTDRFSGIHAVTVCGVIVRDAADEQVIAVNQTAARILGLPSDGPLPRTALWDRIELCRPEGTPLPREDWPSGRALRTGQPQRDTLVRVARPDGGQRLVRVDAVPVRREDGMVAWVVVSFVEVPGPGE